MSRDSCGMWSEGLFWYGFCSIYTLVRYVPEWGDRADEIERRTETRMSKVGTSDSKNPLYCSFCGKSQHEVRQLIAAPTVFICDECVELCMDIIRQENKPSLVKSRPALPTP